VIVQFSGSAAWSVESAGCDTFDLASLTPMRPFSLTDAFIAAGDSASGRRPARRKLGFAPAFPAAQGDSGQTPVAFSG